MKALLLLLLLIVGTVGYLFLGPSGSKGEPAKTVEEGDEQMSATTSSGEPAQGKGSGGVTYVTKEPSQTEQSGGRPLVGGQGFISDAAAVGGYAMGHTQVMVKNRVGKKLDATNKKHNEKLNDLMK